MKQLLFLDDDHARIDTIRTRLASARCELVVVETADECIAMLRERDFDLVMLDHDLGGETYCDSSRVDCGMEVVRWLTANTGAHDAFIVHTMNEVAAASMYLQLAKMGYTVDQASFGSSRFFELVGRTIGDRKVARAKKKRSLGERVGQYLRSLRMGR